MCNIFFLISISSLSFIPMGLGFDVYVFFSRLAISTGSYRILSIYIAFWQYHVRCPNAANSDVRVFSIQCESRAMCLCLVHRYSKRMIMSLISVRICVRVLSYYSCYYFFWGFCQLSLFSISTTYRRLIEILCKLLFFILVAFSEFSIVPPLLLASPHPNFYTQSARILLLF